jgi:hypothetical protein
VTELGYRPEQHITPGLRIQQLAEAAAGGVVRLCLTAQDLKVGDEIVGQGRITSIVRDDNEVAITCGVGAFHYRVAPGHEVWVEGMVGAA